MVVAWREPEITVEALKSIAALDPPVDRLVCVAQEWTDRERRVVVDALGQPVEVVALDSNVGFSAAVNLGMARVIEHGADWVLLLNNDATVAPDCLAACLREGLSGSDVAIVGPAVVFSDDPGTLWFAGGQVSRFGFTRHRGLNRPASRPPPSSDVGYVSGCCALVNTAAWRAVGPFRADYFLYYEDAEWCQRARDAGWRCRYLGRVLCRHAVGVSSGQRGSLGLTRTSAYYLGRNPLRFALESPSFTLRATRLAGILLVWNAYNLWRIVQSRQPAVARAYVRGLWDACRGHMGRGHSGCVEACAPSMSAAIGDHPGERR